ncbi:MAG: hypothetical protein WC759_00060 [Candidatus Micrarchaeia archaeon]|jgi:hypothetical protein
MDPLYIPPDNEAAKKKPEATNTSFYYGVCGPAAVAALVKKPISETLNLWVGKFKGHAPMKEVQATLEKLGYVVERKKGNKAKAFPEPLTPYAIVRIQWLKEDGTEYYWRAATCYTHYVLMQKVKGKWWIFCNGTGWFKKDSKEGKTYLKLGFVSSYLELSPTR